MRLPASGHLLHGNFQSYLDSYVDSLAHLSSHRGFYFARSRACSLGLSFSRSVSVSWFLGFLVSRSLDLSTSRSLDLPVSRSLVLDSHTYAFLRTSSSANLLHYLLLLLFSLSYPEPFTFPKNTTPSPGLHTKSPAKVV